MKHPELTALCAALGLTALAQPALPYSTFASWPSNQVFMSASAISFPTGTYRTALGTIEDRFFYEQPSWMWFTMQYDDFFVGLGNGQSEMWFSGDSAHSPAVTYSWTSGSTLVEADIVFYTGINWTVSTDKTGIWSYGGPARPFRTTAMHELGHAAGLGHENGEYNLMGIDFNHISCNGSVYRSYVGEDAADGLVSLYGLHGTWDKEDLSVTLFKYKGPTGEYSAHELGVMYDTNGAVLASTGHDGQRSYYVEAGQTVRVEFTFENNGESYQSNVQLGYYVSTDNYIATVDRLVATDVIGLGRNDVFTDWDAITLPTDLIVGQQYYLGVIIDYGNAIVETSKANNAAYHAFTVTCDSVASTQFHNLAPNPPGLSASTFTLGDAFWLSSDVSMSGHAFGQVFGFDTPYTLQLGGGQWLLCLDLGGSGEVFGFTRQPGPVISYGGTVPVTSNLCGYTFTAQAIHFGGTVPFALSNAQNITIGG